MTLRLDPRHCLVAALCVGLAAANAQRLASPLVVLAAVAAAAAELGVGPRGRGAGVLLALALLGWWWGSVRLDSIDRSPLLLRVGTAERALLEVTAPPRPGPFDVRVPVRVRASDGSARTSPRSCGCRVAGHRRREACSRQSSS